MYVFNLTIDTICDRHFSQFDQPKRATSTQLSTFFVAYSTQCDLIEQDLYSVVYYYSA